MQKNPKFLVNKVGNKLYIFGPFEVANKKLPLSIF